MEKQKQLQQWLEESGKENSSENRREWLLEVRCPDDKTRKEFQAYLDFCDVNGIEIGIPSFPELIEGNWVSYDFEVAPRIYGSVYDLDTPDNLYTGETNDWRPLLKWKWQQVVRENEAAYTDMVKVSDGVYRVGSYPHELEQSHQFQYVLSEKAVKWNDSKEMEQVKKCVQAYKK